MDGQVRGFSKHVVVIAAAVVVCGIAAAIPWIQLAQLKQEFEVKRREVAFLTATNSELQQQLADLGREREDLDERLKSVRTQLSSATSELDRLRDIQGRYEILREENERLERQVSQLNKERSDAQDRASRLAHAKTELERAAVKLRNRLTLLDRDYQRVAAHLAQLEYQALHASSPPPVVASYSPVMTTPITFPPPVPWDEAAGSDVIAPVQMPSLVAESSRPPSDSPQGYAAPAESWSTATPPSSEGLTAKTIELPPIVVRQNQVAGGVPVQGRLVEVNSINRFVVIDKGARDGVRAGMMFQIVRGSETIAQAIAVRIRPNITACDLVVSRTPTFPQVGDLAIQRTSSR